MRFVIILTILTLSLLCNSDIYAQCPAPQNLDTNNVTAFSVQINWDPVSGASSYETIIDTTTGTQPSQSQGTATSSTTISALGLKSNTTYCCFVRANCGSNGLSNWSKICFTTKCPQSHTTEINNITINSVDLKLAINTSNNPTTFEYEVSTSATSPPTQSQQTNNTQVTINLLIPQTKYYVHSRMECPMTNYTTPWAVDSFVTKSTTDIDFTRNDNTIHIYPNPANNVLTINSSTNLIHHRYYLRSMVGTIIAEGDIEQKETSIDVSNLPHGVYMISIISDGLTTIVKRFCKQ